MEDSFLVSFIVVFGSIVGILALSYALWFALNIVVDFIQDRFGTNAAIKSIVVFSVFALSLLLSFGMYVG